MAKAMMSPKKFYGWVKKTMTDEEIIATEQKLWNRSIDLMRKSTELFRAHDKKEKALNDSVIPHGVEITENLKEWSVAQSAHTNHYKAHKDIIDHYVKQKKKEKIVEETIAIQDDFEKARENLHATPQWKDRAILLDRRKKFLQPRKA